MDPDRNGTQEQKLLALVRTVRKKDELCMCLEVPHQHCHTQGAQSTEVLLLWALG